MKNCSKVQNKFYRSFEIILRKFGENFEWRFKNLLESPNKKLHKYFHETSMKFC